MVLVCMLYTEAQEITSHTFLQYNFVVDIWNWLRDLFEIIFYCSSSSSIFHSSRDCQSMHIQNIATTIAKHFFHSIWITRTINRYNKVHATLHASKMKNSYFHCYQCKDFKRSHCRCTRRPFNSTKSSADTTRLVCSKNLYGSSEVSCHFLG